MKGNFLKNKAVINEKITAQLPNDGELKRVK
jgi:hypothetical protein